MNPTAVKPALTKKQPPERVENDAYGAFCRRVLRGYARRVGNGDVEALAHLVGLAADLDTAIQDAVNGLRSFGYSWSEIAGRVAMTRQAAWQRWGNPRPCAEDQQPSLFTTEIGARP